MIGDNALTAYQKYVVNWSNFNPAHLSSTQHTTTSEYDALNRIRKALYPEARNGQRLELLPGYNKAGALHSLKLGDATYVEEIAYNARGQRILVALDNGVMSRYTYDALTFRLARTRSEKYLRSGLSYTPDSGLRQDLAYTYDLEGSVLSQRDRAHANNTAQGPGNLLREFTHDPLRRLLSATGRESSNVYAQPSWDLNIRPQDHTATNLYTRSYEYDKIGNIQNLTHVAAGHANQNFVRNYNYDSPADNRLSSFTVDSNSFANTYDSCGNLTKEGSTRYFTWSHNDKPVTFSNQAGSSDPTVYTNYFYNSAGERVKKITRKGQKLEVTVYVDGGLFELTYIKPTGTTIDPDRHYNTLYLKDANAVMATRRFGQNIDDDTPATKYYLEDHLGSCTVVLRPNGNLVNREEYYPFGETSFGAYAFKRYRYNGKERDGESGYYEYGQRYYAPWLCRFVSVDPIAEDYPQLSSYNYAGNKPITSPDIEGLQGTVDPPLNEGTSQNGGNEASTQDPLTIAGNDAILKPDNLSVKMPNVDMLNGPDFNDIGESELIKGSIVDNLLNALRTLDSMLVKSGMTLTSDQAKKSDAAAIKATPTSHYDVTAIQEVADMVGLAAKDLNALSGNEHMMDMINSGMDALSGVIAEAPEAMKEIKKAGEMVNEYLQELKGIKEDIATFDISAPEHSIVNESSNSMIDTLISNSQKDSLLYGKGKNKFGSHQFGYFKPKTEMLILYPDSSGFVKVPRINSKSHE